MSFEKVILPQFKKTTSEVWIHDQNTKFAVTANVLKDMWFELKAPDVSGYVRKLEETRGSINFFAGISDWVVTRQTFTTDQKKSVLRLHGEFKHSDKTIYFQEIQVFVAPDIYQVKISSPEVADLTEKSSQKIFDTFLAALQ
jgi:hypothetical protein